MVQWYSGYDDSGVYPVTYTNGSASQQINVTIEESQESLQVIDSTIIVGDAWTQG